MERRFIAWLAISFGILILYTNFVAPRAPRGAGEDAGQVADADAGAAGDDDQPQAGAPPEDAPAADEEAQAPPGQPLAAKDVPLQYVTLGSVDPESPYRMLVTFTNEGAAVRRAELSDPHYRDLHDRAGYLGSLEPTDAEGGGAKIQVVGAGTPAAKAGLRPGDVIRAVGEAPIQSAADFRAAMGDTEPWDTIALTYERAGQAPQTVEAFLIRPPQEVMRPEIENLLSREEPPAEPFNDQPSFLLTLERAGGERLQKDQVELPDVDLLRGRWEIVPRDADPEEYLLVRGTRTRSSSARSSRSFASTFTSGIASPARRTKATIRRSAVPPPITSSWKLPSAISAGMRRRSPGGSTGRRACPPRAGGTSTASVAAGSSLPGFATSLSGS